MKVYHYMSTGIKLLIMSKFCIASIVIVAMTIHVISNQYQMNKVITTLLLKQMWKIIEVEAKREFQQGSLKQC